MKQMIVDRSLKKLSIETLTMKIDRAESPLASFLFVLSFYGESLGGRGFVTVLSTIALQAPLDRARGELSSDTRTLIFHFEIFRGKIGEILRSEIATLRAHTPRAPCASELNYCATCTMMSMTFTYTYEASRGHEQKA